MPMAAKVLQGVVEAFAPERVAISSYGLREGLLYEQMPEALRTRDPLIEVCAWMEEGAARFPGFGPVLADWLAPILPGDARTRRMTLAASLLHDVSWRSHPSSRAEECFDNASRGNLGGLDHGGRVMLAMALLHRYRKSGNIDKYKALSPLLSEEDQRLAKVIRRGLRLAATLAGGDAAVLGAVRLAVDGDGLVMRVPEGQGVLLGEVVEGRVAALASALGVAGRVEVV